MFEEDWQEIKLNRPGRFMFELNMPVAAKHILTLHNLNGLKENTGRTLILEWQNRDKTARTETKGGTEKTKSVFHAKRTRHSSHLLNGRTNHG